MISAHELAFYLLAAEHWERETGAKQGVAGVVLTGAEKGSCPGRDTCPARGAHAEARLPH